jgi:hypothetical protein
MTLGEGPDATTTDAGQRRGGDIESQHVCEGARGGVTVDVRRFCHYSFFLELAARPEPLGPDGRWPMPLPDQLRRRRFNESRWTADIDAQTIVGHRKAACSWCRRVPGIRAAISAVANAMTGMYAAASICRSRAEMW